MSICFESLMSFEMYMVTKVQILDKSVYISHSNNTLEKIMNPPILFIAMSKEWGRLGSLTFVWQLVLEKENLLNFAKKYWFYVASCSCRRIR